MAALAYQPEQHATIQEYRQIELDSGLKHEYVNGFILAMAGASTRHNTIAMNLAASLHTQLRGKPCQPWGSDQRIAVAETNLRAYPDIVVACPPLEWDEELADTITNPVVLVEVLSPSTQAFDQGAKFAHYRHLSSLRDYVVIAQNERRVEHHRRASNGEWLSRFVEAGEIVLENIACRSTLDDVYERIEFSI